MVATKGAKKVVKKVAEGDINAAPKNEPTEAEGVVFVNSDKLSRARDIVALVSGKRLPKNEGESDQKDKFAAFMAEEDVNPKGVEAVQFVYEKLGGLVRTPEEQEEADETAKVAQAKNKKRAIEQ